MGTRDNDSDNFSETDEVDEDLAALQAMDIDADFNVWASFRSSMESRSRQSSLVRISTHTHRHSNRNNRNAETERTPTKQVLPEVIIPAPNSTLSDFEKADLAKWEARVGRKEVFSKRYNPSAEEEKEMKDLAALLGVSDRKWGLMQDKSSIAAALHPAKDEPKPILLKRVPVLLQDFTTGKNRDLKSGESAERELILLTNAIIFACVSDSIALASPNTSKKQISKPVSPRQKIPVRNLFGGALAATNSTKKMLEKAADTVTFGATSKLIRRKFEKCESLTSINAVIDLGLCPCTSRQVNSPNAQNDDDDDVFCDTAAFRVVVADYSYNFVCASIEQKDAWLHALDSAISSAQIRVNDGKNMEAGWKHRIMRTSIFSAAFCGDADMLEKIMLVATRKSIDMSDSSGYTALHYAAMKGHNVCIVMLLDAGADPNATDRDMRTPIYYAAKGRNVRALEMFDANGGTLNDKEIDMIKTEREPSKPGVASASTGMSENMLNLKERGEKLNDLGEKTANLQNDAATYKDLVHQLNRKAKQESKWF